jgi:hypothetical protein
MGVWGDVVIAVSGLGFIVSGLGSHQPLGNAEILLFFGGSNRNWIPSLYINAV